MFCYAEVFFIIQFNLGYVVLKTRSVGTHHYLWWFSMQ